MEFDAVIDKVRKLYNLAEGNSNPEEAASATAMAAKLMERHAIVEADLGVIDETEMEEQSFGEEDGKRGSVMKSRSTWQGQLAHTIAKGFGCAMVWRRGYDAERNQNVIAMKIAGRPDDIAAAVQAKDFCHREIDRLVRVHGRGKGRTWGNNFRLGCVNSIYEAIRAESEALKEELQGQVSDMALVVVNDRSESAAHEFFPHAKTRHVRSNFNREARAAGRAAGSNLWTGTKKKVSA